MNTNVSALFAVVVRVGADHQAHLIVENQVTVLDHVASCCNLSANICHTETFDKASVLFPHKVTVCMSEADKSKVIVAQSVAAVIALVEPFTVGFVSVLLVSVLVLDTVGTATHSTHNTQADNLESVVSVACHSSIVSAQNVWATLHDILAYRVSK